MPRINDDNGRTQINVPFDYENTGSMHLEAQLI